MIHGKTAQMQQRRTRRVVAVIAAVVLAVLSAFLPWLGACAPQYGVSVDSLRGPQADSGLTGRKIIVDTYGGSAPHGGGAFSGKDPSKVDRSAAYATRWVAKNIVAAGLAHRVELQVAYAIGVAEPVSVNVETFGTEIGVTREQIQQAVRKVFDLRPAAIIDELDLKRPIYAKTAAYGHFGRVDVEFPWERTDKVEELKAAIR